MQSDMAEGSGDSYPSDDDEDGDLASGSGDGKCPLTLALFCFALFLVDFPLKYTF